MNETELKYTAYEYYPIGIDSIKQREEYNNSKEFKKLLFAVNQFYKVNEKKINLLNDEFRQHTLTKNIQDLSALDFDRCLTFELDIFDESAKVVFKIRLVISILIPYFFIYALQSKVQLKPYKQLTLPVRKRELESIKFVQEIELIANIVKKVFQYDLFQEKYLKFVIPNVSHSDIREGDFTFFNAFFRGENFSLYE